jgi:hypothetical protein
MTDSIAPNEWGVAQILRDEPDHPITSATFLRTQAAVYRRAGDRVSSDRCLKAASGIETMGEALKDIEMLSVAHGDHWQKIFAIARAARRKAEGQ